MDGRGPISPRSPFLSPGHAVVLSTGLGRMPPLRRCETGERRCRGPNRRTRFPCDWCRRQAAFVRPGVAHGASLDQGCALASWFILSTVRAPALSVTWRLCRLDLDRADDRRAATRKAARIRNDDLSTLLREDRHPNGSAPLWREEERRVRMNWAYWHSSCLTDLPVLVMNRLRFRKENGTIACRGTDRSWAPQPDGWPAGKARMV